MLVYCSLYSLTIKQACFAFELVTLFNELRKSDETASAGLAQEVFSIFENPLNPVAPKAQRKVHLLKYETKALKILSFGL